MAQVAQVLDNSVFPIHFNPHLHLNGLFLDSWKKKLDGGQRYRTSMDGTQCFPLSHHVTQ